MNFSTSYRPTYSSQTTTGWVLDQSHSQQGWPSPQSLAPLLIAHPTTPPHPPPLAYSSSHPTVSVVWALPMALAGQPHAGGLVPPKQAKHEESAYLIDQAKFKAGLTG